MSHVPVWAQAVLGVVMAMFLGLPVMAAVSFYQTVKCRRGGDEALARSWADATRSFVSMLVAAIALLLAAGWGVVWALDYIARGH
jgi:divalent metal cation (Fe/Co/Zn/Cd) transporter